MADEKKKYTAADMVTRLRARFSETQRYVVMEQVAAQTGAGGNSWIDAAVFYLWPSDGLYRSAFEIKVSRGDFLKELQDPTKNQWARDNFHEFWYLAPAGIIKEEELPEGTGLMITSGGGLKVCRAAKRREAPACDDSLLASFARSMQKSIHESYRSGIRDALSKSEEFRVAKLWAEVGKKFLESKNIRFTYEPSIELFEKAVSDHKVIEDANRINKIVGSFRRDIEGMIPFFLALATDVMSATDDAGKAVFDGWGIGNDECQRVMDKKLLAKEQLINETVEFVRMIRERAAEVSA